MKTHVYKFNKQQRRTTTTQCSRCTDVTSKLAFKSDRVRKVPCACSSRQTLARYTRRAYSLHLHSHSIQMFWLLYNLTVMRSFHSSDEDGWSTAHFMVIMHRFHPSLKLQQHGYVPNRFHQVTISAVYAPRASTSHRCKPTLQYSSPCSIYLSDLVTNKKLKVFRWDPWEPNIGENQSIPESACSNKPVTCFWRKQKPLWT
jgi:hypothetical protein